jgi:hypothetical protein
MAKEVFNSEQRQALLRIFTDDAFPAEVRLPAIQSLQSSNGGLLSEDYRALLQVARRVNLVQKRDEIIDRTLSLIATCQDPELRRECVDTLRQFLRDPSALSLM